MQIYAPPIPAAKEVSVAMINSVRSIKFAKFVLLFNIYCYTVHNTQTEVLLKLLLKIQQHFIIHCCNQQIIHMKTHKNIAFYN